MKTDTEFHDYSDILLRPIGLPDELELEHDHERPLVGERLEEPTPGGERL